MNSITDAERAQRQILALANDKFSRGQPWPQAYSDACAQNPELCRALEAKSGNGIALANGIEHGPGHTYTWLAAMSHKTDVVSMLTTKRENTPVAESEAQDALLNLAVGKYIAGMSADAAWEAAAKEKPEMLKILKDAKAQRESAGQKLTSLANEKFERGAGSWSISWNVACCERPDLARAIK